MTPEQDEFLKKANAFQRLGFISQLQMSSVVRQTKQAAQGQPAEFQRFTYSDENLAAMHEKYATEQLPKRQKKMGDMYHAILGTKAS